MVGFIFGGDTGIEGPQELQRRRAVIDALGEKARAAAPRNVGEGLSAIGQALSYRIGEKRLAKKEAGARRDATDQFGRVTSALLGGMGYAAPSVAASAPMQGVTTPPVTTAPVTPNPAGLPQSIIDAVDRVDPPIPATGGQFAAIEAQYGLPPGYLDRTAQIESGGNPNAQNPNSSAGGLFQFIDSTAQQYGLENRFDPAAATDAAARLAADNRAVLMRALGREPTAAELYLAHQQGGGGASALLSNPNARAVDIVGLDAVRLNGGDPNVTAGEFAGKWLNKFAGGGFSTAPAMGGGAVDPAVINQLAELSANPYLPEGQRAVVNALLERQLGLIGKETDPVRGIEFDGNLVNPITGEIIMAGTGSVDETPTAYRALELRAEAAGLQPGTPQYQEFMLTGGSGIGEDRPAAFEALHQQALAAGLIEGSPEYQEFMLTKGSGDAAAAKALGQARGEAKAQINDALAKFEYGINVIDQIIGNKDAGIPQDPSLDAYTGSNIWGGDIGGRLPIWLGGQGVADLDAKAQQLQGQAFLQAFESLKGGGQITEIEGAKAEAAIARLQRTQSKEAYLAALQELRGIMVATIERAKLKAGMTDEGGGADTTDDGWTVIDGVRVREKQ